MTRHLQTFLALFALAWPVVPPRAEPLRIVALGDSITRGVRPGVKPDETFAALVEQESRHQGIVAQVTNAGVGGETTAGAGKRLAKDVLAQKPHVVLVRYGTNDCYVDQGKAEPRVPLPDFKANLAGLLDRLQKAGVLAVVMTEPAYAENGPNNVLGEEGRVKPVPGGLRCRRKPRPKSAAPGPPPLTAAAGVSRLP